MRILFNKLFLIILKLGDFRLKAESYLLSKKNMNREMKPCNNFVLLKLMHYSTTKILIF
jgi:hypothetical protein